MFHSEEGASLVNAADVSFKEDEGWKETGRFCNNTVIRDLNKSSLADHGGKSPD